MPPSKKDRVTGAKMEKERKKLEGSLKGGTSSSVPIALFRILLGFLSFNFMMNYMKSGILEFNYSNVRMNVRFYFDAAKYVPNLTMTSDQLRTLCWFACGGSAALSMGVKANLSAMLVALVNAYLLLMDRAFYTNSQYLLALFSLLLALVQCDGALCAGANNISRTVHARGSNYARVPLWNLKVLQFQACVVIIYSALSKFTSPDWMILGEPLLHHINNASDQWWVPLVDKLSALGLLPYSPTACLAIASLELSIGIGLLMGGRGGGGQRASLALLLAYEGAVWAAVPALRAEAGLLLAAGALFADEAALEAAADWAAGGLGGVVAVGGGAATSEDRRAPHLEDNARASAAPRPQSAVLPADLRPRRWALGALALYCAWQIYLPAVGLFGTGADGMAERQFWGLGQYFSWRPRGLDRGDALVRVIHRSPRAGYSAIDLARAPLNAQHIGRLVGDPEMLRQLGRLTAQGGSGQGEGKGKGGKKAAPEVRLDAWRSLNGRPFARWTDLRVDANRPRARLPPALFLVPPPGDEAAAGTADGHRLARVRAGLRQAKGLEATLFSGPPGEALEDLALGGPSAPERAQAACNGSEVLLGVVQGQVSLQYHTATQTLAPTEISENQSISVTLGQVHTVTVIGEKPAIWFYAHACPEGAFHTYAGLISKSGWDHEYPGDRPSFSSWSMDDPQFVA